MRASYRKGIAWIAHNDDRDLGDPEEGETSYIISILLLADLFGKKPDDVYKAVVSYRKREGLL